MIVEYALVYGPPDPEMPWTLFVLLAGAAGRAEARRLHATMVGTAYGAARALSGQSLQLETAERRVRAAAYPGDHGGG